MTVIARSGSDLPLFCFLIAGSFHFLIFPRKMFAIVLPSSRMWFGRPSPRYAIDVADSAHGIWTQPLHAANWSGVSGASLAPKSTVRFVIALMPPPEPIGPYVTLRPSCVSTACVQTWTSFDTNELPAPVSSVAFGFACAEPATLARTIAAAIPSTPMSVIVFLVKLILPCRVFLSECNRREDASTRVTDGRTEGDG